MSFAAETYDAVNLAALAAAAAEDDAGTLHRGKPDRRLGRDSPARPAAAAKRRRGTPCTSYKECLAAVKAPATRLDYDGESGPVGFDANGDITSANFMVFTYGADNKAKLSGRETAAAAPADRS